MNKIQEIGNVLLILAGLLVLTGNANIPYTPPDIQESEQGNTSQSDDNEIYIQSFDVVSQNLQLLLSSPFSPSSQIIEAEERGNTLVLSNFTLAPTEFFKILFEQIISPNAP